MENSTKLVPALCTQCGGTVEVDTANESGKCPYCGTEFLIEKAVNNYNVKHATIEHVDSVTIDTSGAVKDVLSFVGDQMKQSRQERREAKAAEREHQKKMDAAFMGMMKYMFIGMFAFAIVAFIVLQFTS